MSEHISSSQLTTWLRCPKQYEFRYLQDIKLPPRAALARGSACHKAWELDHKQKIETKKNLPLEHVQAAYSEEFEDRAEQTVWTQDEDKGKIKDVGYLMVKSYYESVSSQIQPIAAEEKFEKEIFGHLIQGVIDLETDKGEIRDAKTSSRKKSTIPFDHQLQMAIYAEAKPDAKRFVLDNAIATDKRSELESLTLTREDLPSLRLEAYLDGFGESLIKGFFPPTNPDNWACSQKWCGYFSICKYGSGKQ